MSVRNCMNPPITDEVIVKLLSETAEGRAIRNAFWEPSIGVTALDMFTRLLTYLIPRVFQNLCPSRVAKYELAGAVFDYCPHMFLDQEDPDLAFIYDEEKNSGLIENILKKMRKDHYEEVFPHTIKFSN